jgi:two-component system response regulator HydG
VRELRNVIERAVIVTTGPLITVADLPAERAHAASPAQSDRPSQISESSQPAHETRSAPVVSEPPESDLPLGQPLREMERQLILKTLEMTGGNRLRTAEILGISPKTLYNKLGRYQAKSTSEKSDPTKSEPEPADEA